MNSNPNQAQQPDPAKAIVLKPSQKTRQGKQRSVSSQTWQPHQSNVAIDSWGVALRTLREQGHTYE